MSIRPSVLCPVDFSDVSRGAWRYAAAIAEHFYAQLTVLAVNDRLLVMPRTRGSVNVGCCVEPNSV